VISRLRVDQLVEQHNGGLFHLCLKLALLVVVSLSLGGCVSTSPVIVAVNPVAETDPVPDSDDAADDPFVLAADGIALIVGTNKRRGLEVYDLGGRRLQQIDTGRLNNVDGVASGEPYLFHVAASNRTTTAIDVFSIDIRDGHIEALRSIPLVLAEPYGLCVSDQAIYVGDKEGLVQAWSWQGDGPLAKYRLGSQTEGCVVDSANQHLYVGEEEIGIWQVDIETGEKRLVAAVDDLWLTADVEGLDIYRTERRSYLLASSQGDNSYVVFDLASHKPLRKFYIAADSSSGIDGSEETDGIAVHHGSIPGYPAGILVVQDGLNVNDRGDAENQNFKVVDWQNVEALIGGRSWMRALRDFFASPDKEPGR
jgi:3-phytase